MAASVTLESWCKFYINTDFFFPVFNESLLAFVQFSCCVCFCVLCRRESKVRPAGNLSFVSVFVIFDINKSVSYGL